MRSNPHRNDPLWAEETREPCPDCEDGKTYYIIDPETTEYIPCTKDDYDKSPEDYRDYEPCPTCNGEGVIYD